MGAKFRRISEASVMCTVQACEHVAAFVYTGSSVRRAGGGPIVAALCQRHAKEVAVGLGEPWPIQEPKREDAVVHRRPPGKARVVSTSVQPSTAQLLPRSSVGASD
jgi:hypothetical protein